MRNSNSFHKKILLLCLTLICLTLHAQTQKVIILSLEDTTIVHRHVGLTAFTNFKDTILRDIPLSKIIEEKLTGYLRTKFELHIIKVPDEIKNKVNGIWGYSKEFKAWIKEAQKGYDLLIVIDNNGASNEMTNSIMPPNTSGFTSRGNSHGVFTTISFHSTRISDNKKFEYYDGDNMFMNLKDFKMPEDKRTFDLQMKETIKSEFIKHIDNRIKYFLVKTYLLPDLQ
jgi:hypothetical protein